MGLRGGNPTLGRNVALMGREQTATINKPAKKVQIKPIFETIFPYLLLLVGSIVSLYPWFARVGEITGGDDVTCHLPWIYDLLYGFRHGFFFSTDHLLEGIFATNSRLYYASFPHYAIAMNAYIFPNLGVIGSIKFTTVEVSFFGGVYAYLLGKKLGGNREFGLAFGFFFLFFPYRLYDFLHRFALSEGFAMSFFPPIFYGLYRICNDKELKPSPFIAVTIGASLLILSHPITAINVALACVLFVLANIWNLVKAQKRNHFFLLYFGIMVTLIVLQVAFYVFPLWHAMKDNSLRISDTKLMWSTLDYVQHSISTGVLFRAGFLDFNWRMTYVGNVLGPDSALSWILGLCFFPLSCAFVIVGDFFTRKYLGDKGWWQLLEIPITGILAYLPMILSHQRIEVYIGLTFFFVAFYGQRYFRYGLHPKEYEEMRREKFSPKAYYQNGDLYASLVVFAVGLIFLFVPQVWAYVPPQAYYIQFSFRLWAITIFAAMLAVFAMAKPFSHHHWMRSAIVALSCFLFALDQAPVDKRIWSVEGGNGWYSEPTEETLLNQRHWTWQSEYVPKIFLQSDYTPTYENSLYRTVSKIQKNATYSWGSQPYWLVGKDKYIDPAVLEGTATVSVLDVNTPSVDFEVTVNEDALIQIPQFYTDGYAVKAVTESGSKVICPVENVDGLVAFRVPEGKYTIQVRYLGTKGQRIGYWLLGLGVVGTIAFGVTPSVIDKKKKKAQAKNGTAV